MSSFGCPHDVKGICQRVRGALCRPGMRGCVLAGKIAFPGGELPLPRWPDRDEEPAPAPPPRRRRTF